MSNIVLYAGVQLTCVDTCWCDEWLILLQLFGLFYRYQASVWPVSNCRNHIWNTLSTGHVPQDFGLPPSHHEFLYYDTGKAMSPPNGKTTHTHSMCTHHFLESSHQISWHSGNVPDIFMIYPVQISAGAITVIEVFFQFFLANVRVASQYRTFLLSVPDLPVYHMDHPHARQSLQLIWHHLINLLVWTNLW